MHTLRLADKDKGGRPTKRTAELERRVLTLLRAGNFRSTACASEGVHRDTFHNWMRTDEVFRHAVLAAEVESETGLLAVILTAAKAGDLDACRWILTRRFRQWAPRLSIEAGELTSFLADLRRHLPEEAMRTIDVLAEAQLPGGVGEDDLDVPPIGPQPRGSRKGAA